MPKFKKPYQKRERVSLSFLDEDGERCVGRCKQSFKNECDVNLILKRYDRDGIITHVARSTAEYGDFTEVNEYRENLDFVMAAQAAFAELPSHVRKRFGNDPGEFFEFATDPKNESELVELGLAQMPAAPEAILVKMEASASPDASQEA